MFVRANCDQTGICAAQSSLQVAIACNSTTTGANLGGAGTWASTVKWYDGTSEVAWSANSNADERSH